MASWKEGALPAAFDTLLTKKSEEFIELIRKALPEMLEIDSKDILEFLQKCKPKIVNAGFTASIKREKKKINPCPELWEKLVSSVEDKYQNGREKLLKGERRKLGEYLVSEDYEPWPQTITWHLLGLPKKGNETKGVTALAVGIYRYWGFIRPENLLDKRDMKYERVEEAMDYLRRLLNN